MDVYQKVTDEIISQLQNGVIPWHKSYVGAGSGMINHVSGKPYSILNCFLLGREGEYLTFNQIQQLGGHVKAGAKARFVVFFKMYEHATVIDGEEVTENIPFLRYYNVFHIDDVEGIQPRNASEPLPDVARNVEGVDSVVGGYFSREGIRFVQSKSGTPSYCPTTDTVTVPEMPRYTSTEAYYADLLHESVHSTGTEARLGRGVESNGHFGSEKYSREELVAEIGSVMAARVLGIDNAATLNNSAAYIDNWISALRSDPRMIVWASSRAEKAVDYILGRENEN